jgi:hypothetical protein
MSISIESTVAGYRELLELVRCRSGVNPTRAGDVARSEKKASGRFLMRTEALLQILMSVGFGIMLDGGRRLFADGTAAGDWPAFIELRIGAGVLLASIALAVASYGFRSSVMTRDPELTQ